MAKIEHSITINAPWEQVDAVSNDGSRFPEWFEGMESADVDDVFPQEGGKFTAQYKAAGMNFTINVVSTSYERGSHLTTRMEGMITGTQHWAIDPQGDDTTQMTVTFDYEVPGGGVGKVLDKLVIERTNSSNLQKSLENLKALVESA